MARVAQLYHVDGMRQVAIAERLHLSQATVSRLLRRAEREGIVRISIQQPRGTYPDLEAALRDRYAVPEVVVADPTDDTEEAILAALGDAAGHWFETTVGDGEVIGISSWSASLLKMVEAIHPLRHTRAERVVQILGGLGNPAVQSHATQLTARLADLAGAEPMLLPAPGVAGSAAARHVMEEDPYVRETLSQFARVTTAFIGIGALRPSQMLETSGNIFGSSDLADLELRGAVGDICLRFFDASGRSVGGALDERVIGMDLDTLRSVPRVVAVAGGARKIAAIRGALLGGLIRVLVTDRFTAAKLAEVI
jgi:DNA-binding transcriptional regulator LsrR (DeoR family)